MKTEQQPLVPKTKFKGYTLEDIKYKMLVNELKIKIQQDRLLLELVPPESPIGVTQTSLSERIDKAISYGQMAFLVFNIFRKASSFFRKFRR